MENPFGQFTYDGFRVHYILETPSTNDLANAGGFKYGDIVITDSQTKGRGQRGNSWESLSGANLTFSLILEPRFLPAARQFLLSQAVSLAISDSLAGFGLTASVKWPNDIYIGDKKIAGILIENDILGSHLASSVVGIGLNVNQPDFSPELPNPVSMRMAAGREFDRVEVLESFCRAFTVRYRQLEEGQTETINKDYFANLYLAGTPHTFTLPDGHTFEGVILETGPGGELIVKRSDNGTRVSFLFKEIIF